MSEPERRRVLIVSPAFPPLNTPDLQRVRMSLPHYRALGWEPFVLTVDDRLQEGPRDESLLATIPSDVRVEKCGAIPLRIGRVVGLGNIGLRAWFHLLLAGLRLIRREKIDLVFFSTTQFITFPLGRIWRRLCGVPYVIDLHDPWRTDYYEQAGVRRPPGGWKYQFARLQAALLEEWSYRRLGGMVSVSPGYISDLCRRYPWFRRVPSITLRFGGSEADLRAARAFPADSIPSEAKGKVRFVYTGAAGPVTPHAVSFLIRGLAAFRAHSPELASRLQFEFIGTSYQPASSAKPSILPFAERADVADLVTERPGRVGHLECLNVQAGSDVLLLLGSSDPAYSPSKVYPYYLAGRPILSLVFRNSQLETILRELNCSTMVYLDDPRGEQAAIEALCAFLRTAVEDRLCEVEPRRNDRLFAESYLAPGLTRQQTQLFDAALPSRPRDASV